VRVALAHDWLNGMRGGEKVLDALCEIFPKAPIYTLLHAPGSVSARIESHPIHTSFLQAMPFANPMYRYYIPFMPWAAARLDLTEYDLVVSSSHCAAKGVRVRPGAAHICYCHTPMRYIWDQYEEYFGARRASWPVRAAMAALRPALQAWDVRTARRVDAFVANSRNVAERIRRHYGREAAVIPPPLDFGRFRLRADDDGYYLVVSALVPYKRVDVAVDAFNELGSKLRIVGSGPEYDALKRRARRNVFFAGWTDDLALAKEYAGCRALIFPGEEDFGIVPLEAMASGKPVIALGRGGALETVRPPGGDAPPTGVFFPEPTAAALSAAVRTFESQRRLFDPALIRARAAEFDRPRFLERMRAFVDSEVRRIEAARA
jgi:glycosyltransferase involved in cell wall biosynthesis